MENVINIIKKVPNKGTKNNSGYMQCSIRKYRGQHKKILYPSICLGMF